MKKILFLIAFSPVLLSAQRVTTFDSLYQESRNGRFYEVRLVEWSTGESSLTYSLIGDTASIFENQINDWVSRARQMAQDARGVSRFTKQINDILKANNTVFAATGRDALDTLTARFALPLLAGGWTVKDTAGVADVEFNINNAGQLRYTVAGFQARNAFLLGDVIRLNNFKSTGQDLDFFKGVGGNWFTIDDRVRLKHPGNQDAVSRGVLKGAKAETVILKPVEPEKKPTKKKKQ